MNDSFEYREQPPQVSDFVEVYYAALGRYYKGKVTQVSDQGKYWLKLGNNRNFQGNPIELKMSNQTIDETNSNRWHFVNQ